MSQPSYAGDLSPQQAWEILADDPRSVLIDVRTPSEWAYVGVPDLSSLGKAPMFVPWALFPTMAINPEFAGQVASQMADPAAPLVFLCRSGARSRAAAITMTRHGYATCYNVASGFEGDLDGHRHRGTVGGWKVVGLPWAQT
jgi:rhodanese-related sulfurtransferase